LPSLDVDVASSRCFPVVNGQPVGGIRLNIAGREPAGVLERRDVDAFCVSLTRDLLDITDHRTGAPAVSRVVRSAGHYSGRAQQDLPDLLVHWSDEVPTGCAGVGSEGSGRVTLSSPKLGRLEGTNDFGRTGEHRPHGFCIVARPEDHGSAHGQEIRLIDLAPSLAAAYGVVLPEARGRVVRGLLD
jgi:predicted AlkP superfamily phosphohydrolase/phosphomutase